MATSTTSGCEDTLYPERAVITLERFPGKPLKIGDVVSAHYQT